MSLGRSSQLAGDTDRPLTGRHVLFAFVGLFAVVLAVNVVFISLAVSTFPGLDREDSYRIGLSYNQTLEASARQAALGWTARLGVAPDGRSVVVDLADRRQATIRGRTVVGRLARPAGAGTDIELAFVERAPGRYVAPLPATLPGNWIAEVTITPAEADVAEFRLKERLWLKPTQ